MATVVANTGLLSDTKLHVDDTGGSGRPVVLIHGWPLSGESWKGQVPALQAAGYRVVTYDRRGFGRGDKKPSLKAMAAFGSTDFRADLPALTVPTLVLHGDSDATVPFEGSGARTHAAITHSELVVLAGAPHGCNVSHADQFNAALLAFLAK